MAVTDVLALPPGPTPALLAEQQQQQQQQPPDRSMPRQVQADISDCLGCRVTGLMLGLGGCGYVSSRLLTQPYPVGVHRAALLVTSGALLALGVARAHGW